MYRPRSCPPWKGRFDAKTMGSLPPQTLDDVYFCVRSVLSSLAAGLTSAECTSLVTDMVCSVVHRAVADFSTTWNDSAPAILPALPNELWISCLSCLPFRDRVVASHVSSGWRQFMLATPSLWDDIDVSKIRSPCAREIFQSFVSRSGEPVVLDVKLHAGWVILTDGAAALPVLDQISSRLRSLTITLPVYIEPTLFENFAAPILEHLRFEAGMSLPLSDATLQFPSHGRTLMPNLKHLFVYRLRIPAEFEPMHSLETFEGRCCQDSDMHNLFALFPCLTAVTLHDAQCVPDAAPPLTLKAAKLHVISTHADPVAILHTFTAVPNCAVELSTIQATAVAETVGMFARDHSAGPWHLSLGPGHYECAVTARRGSDDVFHLSVESLQFDPATPMPQETFRQAHFAHLQALTLAGAALCSVLLAEAHLPALETLTIMDEDYGPESMLRHALVALDPPPMRAPALRAVCLTLRPTWLPTGEQCTVHHLSDFIASRLRYDAETLQQITVVHSNRTKVECLTASLTGLSKLASGVLSITPAGEEWLVPEPEEVEDDTLHVGFLLEYWSFPA